MGLPVDGACLVDDQVVDDVGGYNDAQDQNGAESHVFHCVLAALAAQNTLGIGVL